MDQITGSEGHFPANEAIAKTNWGVKSGHFYDFLMNLPRFPRDTPTEPGCPVDIQLEKQVSVDIQQEGK